jgi:hypothetical protein
MEKKIIVYGFIFFITIILFIEIYRLCYRMYD